MKRFICLVIVAVATASILFGASLQAAVKMPTVFATNMLLQRDMPVPVWGEASPGEKVTVSFCGQTESAVADDQAKWMVTLAPLKAGGPFEMIIQGENTIKLENILVGELWICSGQSNMEWTLLMSEDSKNDIPNTENPDLRLFYVDHVWSHQPKNDLSARWMLCNPETTKNFSAVAYYFGKLLSKELGVPVGLINTSWGGTRIEPWIPPVGFAQVPALESIYEQIEAKNPKSDLHKKLVAEALGQHKQWLARSQQNLQESKIIDSPPAWPRLLAPFDDNQQQPTLLYNAMVHPLVPMAVRGAIWYQGESNNGEGMIYAEKMKALIGGWRNLFRNNDLGFYYVQLAPFNYGGADPENLAKIWEAQSSVEKEIPKTGMVVINDIGNLTDIHPDKKNIVAERLAKSALNRTYNKSEIACSFPEYKSFKVEGNTLIVEFDNAKLLQTRDGQAPDWFTIAGADGTYLPATAVIDGVTVRLTNPDVEPPYAVRFAWSMLAEPNLQNELGLPVSAFRAGDIPERGKLDTLVPEAKSFQLVYGFNPAKPVLLDGGTRFEYSTDNSKEISGKIKRVGYFIYIKPKEGDEQFVFVTMPPLSQEIGQLGVPVKSIGVRFQQSVSDVTVKTNVPGVFEGHFPEGCNVEFWDCNYSQVNSASIPDASDATFDFGDKIEPGTSPGHGCMQLHHHAKKQTIFSFNAFSMGNNCDIGIGNCPAPQPDWTFSASAKNTTGTQFLILVETE